jgi:hypothetical protein
MMPTTQEAYLQQLEEQRQVERRKDMTQAVTQAMDKATGQQAPQAFVRAVVNHAASPAKRPRKIVTTARDALYCGCGQLLAEHKELPGVFCARTQKVVGLGAGNQAPGKGLLP